MKVYVSREDSKKDFIIECVVKHHELYYPGGCTDIEIIYNQEFTYIEEADSLEASRLLECIRYDITGGCVKSDNKMITSFNF